MRLHVVLHGFQVLAIQNRFDSKKLCIPPILSPDQLLQTCGPMYLLAVLFFPVWLSKRIACTSLQMDAASPDAGKVRLWARGEVIQMWMARWNALPSRVVQQILLAALIAGCFINCSGMERKEAQAQKFLWAKHATHWRPCYCEIESLRHSKTLLRRQRNCRHQQRPQESGRKSQRLRRRIAERSGKHGKSQSLAYPNIVRLSYTRASDKNKWNQLMSLLNWGQIRTAGNST